MRITNIQKKELSEKFRNHGLNIFDFDTSGEYKEFKVKFKHDYFSFTIDRQKEDVYYLTIFPVDNTAGYSMGATWEQTKAKFTVWTKQISDELNTATGWESFQTSNYLNAEFEDLQKDFTTTEKTQARQSILELKGRVKALDLSETSLQIIESKLDNLSKKVDELNKFDWKSLFLGTIASLIMTLSIPPDASGLLWEYIKSAFSGLKLKG